MICQATKRGTRVASLDKFEAQSQNICLPSELGILRAACTKSVQPKRPTLISQRMILYYEEQITGSISILGYNRIYCVFLSLLWVDCWLLSEIRQPIFFLKVARWLLMVECWARSWTQILFGQCPMMTQEQRKLVMRRPMLVERNIQSKGTWWAIDRDTVLQVETSPMTKFTIDMLCNMFPATNLYGLNHIW